MEMRVINKPVRQLFFASLKQFSDRFPVMLTFVNQINKRSENAHNKVHMETIGTFDFGDHHYFLMGIRTDAADRWLDEICVQYRPNYDE